jgi:hypothetical protein
MVAAKEFPLPRQDRKPRCCLASRGPLPVERIQAIGGSLNLKAGHPLPSRDHCKRIAVASFRAAPIARRATSRRVHANTAAAHKLALTVNFTLTRGEAFVDQGHQHYE